MIVRYLCPLADEICSWEGAQSDVLPHFEDEHADSLTYTNVIEIDTSIEQKKSNVLMHYLNRTYLVQTALASDDKGKSLSAALRFLGTPEEAAEHRYSIELSCGTFKITRTNSHIITSRDGILTVDLSQLFLMTESKNLSVSVVFERRPKPSCYSFPLEDVDEDVDGGNVDTIQGSHSAFGEVTTHNEETVLETRNPNLGNRDSSKGEFRFLEDNEDDHQDIQEEAKDNCPYNELDSNQQLIEMVESEDECEPTNVNDTLLSSFVCVACSQYTCPPIYTCTGRSPHVVCVLCKMNFCVICDKEIVRDKALENASANVYFPCLFCRDSKLRSRDLLQHQLTCRFAVYKCPICETRESFHMFGGHFSIDHKQIEVVEQTAMPFPPGVAIVIKNARSGIYLCSAIRQNNVVKYRVIFCGDFKIYVQCDMVFMGKRELRYSFCSAERNTFVTEVKISDLKRIGVKAKYGVLHINTDPMSSIYN